MSHWSKRNGIFCAVFGILFLSGMFFAMDVNGQPAQSGAQNTGGNAQSNSGFNVGQGGAKKADPPPPSEVKDSSWLNLNSLLFAIVEIFAKFIAASVALIAWTLEPSFMDLIRNNPGVYAGWRTMRDILNLFFIFFLLYSAFCTVFQVSRYHIRNTWVMIVVMALLVNFSWPIARVLIDFSNVTMDWMLHGTGMSSDTMPKGKEGSHLMATIGNETRFARILVGLPLDVDKPDVGKVALTQLILAIIISLIFLIVVLTIAALLVIRVVALAILLVFAAAGFTLAAFPSTASYANRWWDSFIKYLVTGPLLLFVLILSVSIMQGNSQAFEQGMMDAAKENAKNAPAITNLMKFFVSLSILWTGIMTVGAMGDAASSAVLGAANKARGKVQKGLMGTAVFLAGAADTVTGRKVSAATATVHGAALGVRQRFRNMADDSKERYAGIRDMASARVQKVGTGIGTAEGAGRTKRMIGKVTGAGGDKNAIALAKGARIEAEKKKLRERPLNTATDHKAEAQAQLLSEKKVDLLDKEVDSLIKTFDKLDEETKKAVKKKMRESGYGHKVAEVEIAEETRKRRVPLTADERADITKKVYGNMDAKTLAKQKIIVNYDSGNADSVAAFKALVARQDAFQARSRQDFMDALGNNADAYAKNVATLNARMERDNLRGMNT